MRTTPTIEHAKTIVGLTRAGVCSGLGTPKPGQMCIEALVCFALGEEHGANPSCVCDRVAAVKVTLNDRPWFNAFTRGVGLQKIALAQLGSKDVIDSAEFLKYSGLYFFKLAFPVLLKMVHEELESLPHNDNYPIREVDAYKKLIATIQRLVQGVENADQLGILEDGSSVSYLICNVIKFESASVISQLVSIKTTARFIEYLSVFCQAIDKRRDSQATTYLRQAIYSTDSMATDCETILKAFAEAVLQALIKVKSPGCQWLYLTAVAF